MKYYTRKYCILFLLLVLISFASKAQIGGYAMGNAQGIYFTAQTGASMLITEIYRDLSGSVTEFNNHPGPAFGFEISKYLTENIEVGASIAFSWLHGDNNHPDFSAIGHHSVMTPPMTDPVEYTTRLYGPKIFARYHFNLSNPRRKHPVGVYLNAGFGMVSYESELFYKYRTDNEIIFGKGFGENKTTKVSNAVYVLGSGFTYALTNRIDLKTAFNLNFVNYDFLDVVHNYDEQGERRWIIGVFSDLSIGISIKLDKSMVSFDGKKIKPKNPVYQPFYRLKH